MNKIILSLMLLVGGCTVSVDTPTEDKAPTVMPQDLESCVNDSDTPWCKTACNTAEYTWCVK